MLTSHVSRRDWLRAAGVTAVSASGWIDVLAARAAAVADRPKYKSCIVLFLPGGLSQLESWDPKPEAPADWRGPFRPIATAVPGVQVSEMLPKIAAQMKDIALLRSLDTGNNTHGPACQNMHHSGLFPGAAVKKANFGSAISAALAPPDFGMPTHIVIGRCNLDRDMGNSGFLGPQHAPMTILDPAVGLASLRPAVEAEAFNERFQLFQELELGFAKEHALNTAVAHRVGYQNAFNFMQSSKAKAFDLSHEAAPLRAAYGQNQFGDGCLMARRLVEIGVPFVEVKFQAFKHGLFGDALLWDTHSDMDQVARKGLPMVDAAYAALIRDLKDRGLFENTLVICMSEMGRGPEPEKKGGRSHFTKGWTIALAGGGVKGGVVVGKTVDNGTEVADRPISAVEFLATVCTAVGIDPQLEFSTRDGRPMNAQRTPIEAMRMGAGAQLLGKDPPVVKEIF